MSKEKDLLKFAVVGSVDDGKSTLIGRLLYDSKSLYEDQLEAIEAASKRRGEEHINLALLTDGLRAEREQGITIDVAYRYFSTEARKFIIADCPGHIEYTRNMVTGSSGVNLATILIDARQGVLEQTRRHAFILSLLKIKHLVVCVNKMDLVEFKKEFFDSIKEEFTGFLAKLDIPDVTFIPISALNGDNVVDKSSNMPWYKGTSYLYALENKVIAADRNHVDCRFPIQNVIRPMKEKFHDFRAYAGRIESGTFRPGNEVVILPSGFKSKIKEIYIGSEKVEEAFSPMSVSMTIEDDIDISRGDMIVGPNNLPEIAQDLEMMVCWLAKESLNPKGKYLLKSTTRETKCKVKDVVYKIDINSLHRDPDSKEIGMNDIGRVKLRSASPLFIDSFKKNKATGGVIIIDLLSNNTVGAGMIL